MSKDKAGFTARLEVSPEPDGKHWRLMRSFGYYRFGGDIPPYIDRSRSLDVIVVPAGFVTDFASIPWPLWSFIGASWGRYGKAAVIHDFLYQHHGYEAWPKDTGVQFARWHADDIFLEAMVVLNVAGWRRRLMYRGVRWFGWLAWRRCR